MSFGKLQTTVRPGNRGGQRVFSHIFERANFATSSAAQVFYVQTQINDSTIKKNEKIARQVAKFRSKTQNQSTVDRKSCDRLVPCCGFSSSTISSTSSSSPSVSPSLPVKSI